METYPAHVVVAWIGHSETVARKHYLQTTDTHFEKAAIRKPAELVASLDIETNSEPNELVAHQVAHKAREMVKTDKPAKKTNPAKRNVLRGSADGFATLQDQKITRPGLEPGTTEPKSVVLPLHHRVTWTSAESVVAKADADFAEFQANFIQ